MILTALRKQLRHWLQDTSDIQWTDQNLDRYINLALRETEAFILGVDPEAFKCTYTAATTIPATGRDNIYSWPAGTFAVHEVAISADGINYVPRQMLPLKTIRQGRSGEIGSIAGFVALSASHWILWPSATSVVAAGIRVIVAPTLVMADDNDQSPLPHAYETMNLKQAQLFALWDVGEPTDVVKKEIEALGGKAARVDATARGTEPPLILPSVIRY